MYPIFVATGSYREATYYIKSSPSKIIRSIPFSNITTRIENMMGLDRRSIILVLNGVDNELLKYIQGKFDLDNIIYEGRLK